MAENSKIDDGGAAFPGMASDGHRDYRPGLTKRDYFAAAALTGLLANSEAVHAGAEPTNSCLFTGKMFADYAGLAVKMADALIAASKTGGPEHG
jgi:hypothetical protein